MPFKSKKQARWMFWKYPAMAKRWAKETPSIKSLPEKKDEGGAMEYKEGGTIFKKLLSWRKGQKRIMKPFTFQRIKERAMKRYGIGEERAAKVAGAAYWKTAKSKYKGKADGGEVEGEGTYESDSIPAKIKKHSFVVPAENAMMAEMLKMKYLGKETKSADLNQKNGMPVMLSDGEHIFSPDEALKMHNLMNMNKQRIDNTLYRKEGINAFAPKGKPKYKLSKFLNYGI